MGWQRCLTFHFRVTHSLRTGMVYRYARMPLAALTISPRVRAHRDRVRFSSLTFNSCLQLRHLPPQLISRLPLS